MAVNPTSWSTTPGSNTTVDSISIAEGMQPAGVNNAMRSMMAGVKELADILTGAKTLGGSADTYTLTTGMSLSAYAAGQAFLVEVNATNTGASTINVDSIGQKSITRPDGSALVAGDMVAGGFALLAYEAGGDDFCLLNPATTGTFDQIFINEAAAAASDVAGDGQLWVKNDTPNTLWFTDDAGNDYQVATLTGAETLTDKTLKDYGETVNVIGSIGGGTQDISMNDGNVVTATVDTSTTTFTFSDPYATGTTTSFTLILTNGGSQTVNWPASVDWAGGAAPTLTTSGVDVLTFVTVDGGTIWYGFAAGLDMS